MATDFPSQLPLLLPNVGVYALRPTFFALLPLARLAGFEGFEALVLPMLQARVA
jgi:hypothetical protein